MAVTAETATLPLPSDTIALEAVRSPVVIVETAPAMLATRLASTAVVIVALAVILACKAVSSAVLKVTLASRLASTAVVIAATMMMKKPSNMVGSWSLGMGFACKYYCNTNINRMSSHIHYINLSHFFLSVALYFSFLFKTSQYASLKNVH